MADNAQKSRGAAERRRTRRHPASRLPKVHASILAGPDVKVVDVSPNGLQVETDVRLIPGAGICLTIKFENESYMVGGRVARVDTVVSGNKLKYRAGIALDDTFAPFDLPTPEPKVMPVGEATSAPADLAPRDAPEASRASAVAARPAESSIDALRQALDEKRHSEEHGRRVMEMLKAALRASERSRRELEEERTRERDTWQQERRTLEQALEMAARHKEKLSGELSASATREAAIANALEEERIASQAQRDALQRELDAAKSRSDEGVHEIEAIRDAQRRLECTLDEERAMLDGLLKEKERLLAELEVLRPRLEALSEERARVDAERARAESTRERLAQQLEGTERWCAEQQELIYELWQQTMRSSALIEGWKAAQGRRTSDARGVTPGGEVAVPVPGGSTEPAETRSGELATAVGAPLERKAARGRV